MTAFELKQENARFRKYFHFDMPYDFHVAFGYIFDIIAFGDKLDEMYGHSDSKSYQEMVAEHYGTEASEYIHKLIDIL